MKKSRHAMVVARQKRRQRVEDYLLRGYTNQRQIAAALGVTQATISKDIRWIEENWVRRSKEDTKLRRARRIQQLSIIAAKALSSYEMSKKNVEEVSVIRSKRKCEVCDGTGMKPGSLEWCGSCGGEGAVCAETVHTRTKGQAGDASFLKVAKDCFTECAKLEALYPKTKRIEGRIAHAHAHMHRVSEEGEYSSVSSEAILMAKMAIARLEEESKRAVIASRSSEGGSMAAQRLGGPGGGDGNGESTTERRQSATEKEKED